MAKEPLYPHVPKGKALYPHETKPTAAKAPPVAEAAKEVTKKSFEVRFARKYTGEMKSIIVQAPDEIDAVPIARKQLGLDITEWIPERVIIPKVAETAKPMTRAEWQESEGIRQAIIEWQKALPGYEARTAIKRLESESARIALKEGKPVPAEVLKDYPELAKAVSVKVTPAPGIISRPKIPRPFLIRQEPEPWAKGGLVYRAYEMDGYPLRMGDESREALIKKLKSFEDVTEIIDAEPLLELPTRIGEIIPKPIPAIPKAEAGIITLYRGEQMPTTAKAGIAFAPHIETAQWYAGKGGKVMELKLTREEFDKLSFVDLPSIPGTKRVIYYVPQELYARAKEVNK